MAERMRDRMYDQKDVEFGALDLESAREARWTSNEIGIIGEWFTG
jgi:hypothetical protein